MAAAPDLSGECFVAYLEEGVSNNIPGASLCSVQDTPDDIEDFRSAAMSEQDEDDFRRVPAADETTDDFRVAAMTVGDKGDAREAVADGGTTNFRAEFMTEHDEDDYRKVVMRDKRASDLIASAGLVRGRGNFRAVSSTGGVEEDFRSNAMAIRDSGDWRSISPETEDVKSDWRERVTAVQDKGDFRTGDEEEVLARRASRDDTLAIHDLEAFKSEKWKTYMLGPYKAALETVFGKEPRKPVLMKFQKCKETMIANDDVTDTLPTEKLCYDTITGGEEGEDVGGTATTQEDVRISPPGAFKNDVCRPVDWTEDDAKLLKTLSGRVLTQTEL